MAHGHHNQEQLTLTQKSEFTLQSAHRYDRSSTARWVLSHIFRYKGFLALALILYLFSALGYSSGSVLVGQAAEALTQRPPDVGQRLAWLSLAIIGVLAMDGVANLLASYSAENIAKRFEADARDELYVSLLGKSQTFHDRQRVGDIMARATDDVGLLSSMVMPGASLILETVLSIIIPLVYIGLIEWRLLLVPLLFVGVYILAVRDYSRQLEPVSGQQRAMFGAMNAGLEETVSGIEIVKASAQENFEREKFRANARTNRDLAVKQGYIEARYLPLLLYAFGLGLTFLHAMWLHGQGIVTIAEIIAVMGLWNVLRFPTFISIWTFSLVQAGLASAERILHVLRAESELDENTGGHQRPIRGEIVFEDVSFGFEGRPLLKNVSFHVRPGQTVAIVGQTGSGKTALTQLINRTYDAVEGRVRVDGVDVREWNMTALRSQISKIEQDIFLFSRSIADNIAFGKPDATRAEIEGAARAAQAHDFILAFKEGYNTVVGERGVTLSGGQKQRIAIARALLRRAPLLLLDDCLSSVDTETEEGILRGLQAEMRGRTSLIVSHRVSTVRHADLIVVLEDGAEAERGTHDALVARGGTYAELAFRQQLEEELEAS
jgi:ATP-binding cassette subfamily B protein